MMAMKDSSYNIFAKLAENIDDFDDNGVYIVGKPSASNMREKNYRGRACW